MSDVREGKPHGARRQTAQPRASVFRDNMFSCCRSEPGETVSHAFSPAGRLAGLVTRLNRHGYFISRPPKRTHDPTRDPRNGGPRVGPAARGWISERQASAARSRVLLFELAALSRVPCGTPLFAKLLTRQIYRAVARDPDGRAF